MPWAVLFLFLLGAPAGAGAVRVVSLDPVATEMLLVLGARDRLVAVDPASARIPGVGSLPLADGASAGAFSPDLVLASSGEEIASGPDAPTARILVVEPHDFDDAWDAYRRIGAALGQEAASRRYVREASRPLAEIGAASFGARRPRVMAVLAVEPLEIAGGHSFITDLIELAGGESVSHGIEELRLRWSPAQLARAAPELVLLVGPREPHPLERARVRSQLGPAVRIEPLVLDPERFWIHDAVPALERVRAWIVEQLAESTGG